MTKQNQQDELIALRKMLAEYVSLVAKAEAALGDLFFLLNHQKNNSVDGTKLVASDSAHALHKQLDHRTGWHKAEMWPLYAVSTVDIGEISEADRKALVKSLKNSPMHFTNDASPAVSFINENEIKATAIEQFAASVQRDSIHRPTLIAIAKYRADNLRRPKSIPEFYISGQVVVGCDGEGIEAEEGQ